MLLHLTSAATLPCKNKILVLHLQCNIRTNVASKFTGSNLTNYSMEDSATRRFETYSRNRMDRARLDRAIIRQCCHHPSARINASAILNTVFRLTRRFETYSRNRMDRARLDRAIIRQCCHHPSARINASAILNTVFRLTHHSDSDFCCGF